MTTPMIGPSSVEVPPNSAKTIAKIENSAPNTVSGKNTETYQAKTPPVKPATSAQASQAIMRARTTSMPAMLALNRFSRMACSARPKFEERR